MAFLCVVYAYILLHAALFTDGMKLGTGESRWFSPTYSRLAKKSIQLAWQSQKSMVGPGFIVEVNSLSPAAVLFSYPACSKERLMVGAACHCYIAQETNLITAEMAQQCDQVFRDIQVDARLGAACLPFANPDLTLDLEIYGEELELTQDCSSSSVSVRTLPLLRQAGPSDSPPPIPPPTDDEFDELVEKIKKYSGLDVPITEDISIGWRPIFNNNGLDGFRIGIKIKFR